MYVHLSPEQEQHITAAVSSGAYHSPDEVIARALETLHQQDSWLAYSRALIEAKVKRGIEQLDRGEGIPENELTSYLYLQKTQS